MADDDHAPTTAPKPFVFVLMPFKPEFDDIYKFGIKGAASDVGAYAERVDEQNYQEDMLDRIYNQISKADVIVSDMTGQNPNVFYEVGYAHALDKVVVLLTQRVEDIPFDLRHRQHIVYGGRIEALRQALAPKLTWAIEESRRGSKLHKAPRPAVMMAGTEIPERSLGQPRPSVSISDRGSITHGTFTVRNVGSTPLPPLRHVYLLTPPGSVYDFGTVVTSDGPPLTQHVESFPTLDVDRQDAAEGFATMYRLPAVADEIPPRAAEPVRVGIAVRKAMTRETLRLRFYAAAEACDYDFDLTYGRDGASDARG